MDTPPTVQPAPVTVRIAYVRFYLRRRSPTLSTQRDKHRPDVRRWQRVMGAPHITTITGDMLDEFRARCLAAGLAPATIEGTVGTVLAILRTCEECGVIDRVPGPGRRLPIPPPDPDCATLDELDAMLTHADAACWPLEDRTRRHHADGTIARNQAGDAYTVAFWRALIAVAYFTGARRSDLLRLQIGDVSGDRSHFVAGKTRKSHRIPLHPACKRTTLAFAPKCPADVPAFRIGLKQLAREMRAICDAAGIRSVTPQMIRRLSVNEWERARPGCGALIQGSGLRGSGSLKYYLRPETVLEQGVDHLRVPGSLQTADEREREEEAERKLLQKFRGLDAAGRAALGALMDRIA